MLQNVLKRIVKSILLIIGGGILGAAILTLVFYIPVNSENKAEAVQLLESEGWYPATPMHAQSFDTYFHSFLPGVMDNSTDDCMITRALDETEGSPIVRAMNMRDYSYYWHGYVSILRPLFYLFNYSEIRILNMVLQLLVVFLLFYEMARKKNIQYAVLLLTSYVLLMPLALAVSFQYSWVFYIATAGCLFLLKKTDYLEEKSRYVYFFMIMGMLTSFFDLLTYPLFTWAFPLIWWLICSPRFSDCRGYLRRCVSSGFCWIAGYGGMWINKWWIGSLITGENIIENAVNEVFLRVGMENGGEYTLYNRLEAIYFNWKHYEYAIFMLVLLAWLVWLGLTGLKKGCRVYYNMPALLLTGFSSIVWYWVLANHTREHHFFTYRIFGIGVLAILAILLESVSDETDETKQSLKMIKGKVGIAAIWLTAAVCGAGLTLFAKEDVTAINGAADTAIIALQKGQDITVDFVPTFSGISNVGLAMDSESTEGEYEIALYQEDTLLYRENISMESYKKSNYATVDVDWKLKRDEHYTMKISVVGNNKDVNAIVTVPAQMPMNEFSEMMVNGEAVGGQPVMGITYRTLPTSRKTLLFIMCTWTAICVAVAFTGCALKAGRCKKEKGAALKKCS